MNFRLRFLTEEVRLEECRRSLLATLGFRSPVGSRLALPRGVNLELLEAQGMMGRTPSPQATARSVEVW